MSRRRPFRFGVQEHRAPHFLIGTHQQVEEDLLARRERYGISFVIVPGEVAEDFAAVVRRLAGN